MKERNIKILEIGPFPPPNYGWGVRIKFVVEQLRNEGVTCQVLNLGEHRRLKSPAYVSVESGLDYLRKVVQHVRDGYHLHMHTNGDSVKGFIVALIPLLASWIVRRRAVLTFHAGPDQLYFPKQNSRLLFPILYLILALPQKIICNLDGVKAGIVEYGINPDKIVSIPAFSRQYLEQGDSKLPDDLEEFVELHDPLITAYILFRPEFFHQSVLECIRILKRSYPNIGVVIAGGSPETSEGGENVRDLVSELEIEGSTFFAGNLPHGVFLNLFQRSRLYLRSHTRDGVCSSVLEAMALGVPVVANHDGIRPPGVIEFRTNDANDMAEKSMSVLSTDERPRGQTSAAQIEDTVQAEVDLLKSLAPAR